MALKVVIIGAGVAGLAAAYGLAQPDIAHKFDVRILEKRTKEQTLDAGFPIHISPSGLDAISSLLTPADKNRLHLAKQKLPARHDGISFLNTKGKRIWNTYRKPFESNLIERGDLLDVLKSKVGDVEYGREVAAVKDVGAGAAVILSNGEIIHAHLVIGADGMYSAVRKALYRKDDFDALPWVTCNFRLSPAILAHASDRHGINVFYGTGWSAALLPTAEGVYVALTVPAPVTDVAQALADLPDSPILNAIGGEAGSKGGRAFPLYSAKRTKVGRGRIVLIADAAHGMNPFCGAGASMALHDAANLVKTLTGSTDIDRDLINFHAQVKKTADPMIKLSKTLLWLAQGKTPLDRAVRGTAFRMTELVETILPTRRHMRRELNRVLAEEKLRKEKQQSVVCPR